VRIAPQPTVGDLPGIAVIGISTGGPAALERLLPALPATLPWPVVVAQHMPASFTGVFARRLDKLCALSVQEVTQPVPLAPGSVYIARGDADLLVARRAGILSLVSVPASESHPWHPSVTRLVDSAAEHLPPDRMIGIQMTGMGDDGAEAMARLHKRGMKTIAQDEASSAVFGMPNELIRRGGAGVVLSCEHIAAQLLGWLGIRSFATASTR